MLQRTGYNSTLSSRKADSRIQYVVRRKVGRPLTSHHTSLILTPNALSHGSLNIILQIVDRLCSSSSSSPLTCRKVTVEYGPILLSITSPLRFSDVLEMLSARISSGKCNQFGDNTFFSVAGSVLHSLWSVLFASTTEIPFMSPLAHLSFVNAARAFMGCFGRR